MKGMPRKGLSILLSLVMILGCLSTTIIPVQAAPPDMTNPAIATAVNAFDAAMTAAENAGAFTSGNAALWTYTSTPTNNTTQGGSLTTTITDNTDGAYVLKAAQAFEALLQPSLGLAQYGAATAASTATQYPYTWLTHYYSQLAKGYLGYTGAKLHLVGAFVNMRQNGQNVVTAEGLRTTIISRDGPDNGANNSARSNTTTTVSAASEIHALRAYNSYAEVAALLADGGVTTRIVFGVNNSTIRNDAGNANRYNVFSANSLKTTTISRAHDEIDRLVAFNNHFIVVNGVGTAGQTDPFTLDAASIAALIEANNAAYSNAIRANGFTEADIIRFYDAQKLQDVKDFMALCLQAQALLGAKQSVEFFQAVPNGLIARVENGIMQQMKILDLQNLWAEQQVYYDAIMALTPEVLAKAVAEYGLDLPAIEAARSALRAHLDVLELNALKKTVHQMSQAYADYKAAYTGPIPTSAQDEPAFSDYKNYLDAYFYAFDDDTLLAMDTELGAFFAAITSYPAESIAVVFPEGYAYVVEFASGVTNERLRRNIDNESRGNVVFFSGILSKDLAAMNTSELQNLYNEALNKRSDFYVKMEEARLKIDDPAFPEFTQQGFDQLFTSFLPTIDEAIDKIGNTMLGRITAQVDVASSLYDGQTSEVNYENVAQMRKVLGMIESDLYDFVLTTPYMTDALQAAYEKLNDAILEKYNKFIENNAVDKYEQKKPEYPVREPYDTDLAREGSEIYAVTDELMDATVAKLDAMLTNQSFIDLVGLDLGGTFGNLFDGLWSDDLVNTVVSALYPAVLNGIEDILADAPIESEAALQACLAACGFSTLPDDISIVGGATVTVNSVGLKSFHQMLAENTPFQSLRLYPDLLANIMPPEYAGVRAALLQAGPEVNWNTYRTNAWEHSAIYKDGKLTLDWGVDTEPEPFLADGTTPNPLYGMDKEQRFRHAFATSLSGLWDLLAALLCGQPLDIKQPQVNSKNLQVNLSTLGIKVRMQNVSLQILVEDGTNGYAEVLTPLFESVFGLDPAMIPSVADMKAFTGTRQLVDAIFDPLVYYFTDVLAPAPLTGILELLPNLSYAVVLDRILAALLKLEANLTIVPDGATECCTSVSNWGTRDTLQINYGCFCGGQTLVVDYPLNVIEMVAGGCDSMDLSLFGDPEGLITCLTNPDSCLGGCIGGCLGGGDGCDGCSSMTFNFGEVLQFGEMLGGLPSKRPPSTWVTYTPYTEVVNVPYQELEPVEVPVLDSNGEKIPLMGTDGKPILKLDGNGDPIPVLDSNSDPVMVPVTDETGAVIMVPVLDGNGDPVMVPVLDENDEPVLDGEGQPVMEPLFEPQLEPLYEWMYQTVVEMQNVTKYREETVTRYTRTESQEDEMLYHIDADEGDVLLYLLRYVFGAMSGEGGGLLGGLFGGSESGLGAILGEILEGVSDNSDDAIAALIELFNPQPTGYYKMDAIDWAYLDGSNPKVAYSKYWTKSDADFLAANFIPYLDDVIRLLGVYDGNGQLYSIQGLLNELVGGLGTTIYSPKVLNSIGKMLKDLLGGLDLGDEINALLDDQLGISPNAWDFVTEDYFNFADGDRAAFVDGLLQLLRPIYPLLGFLLNSQDIGLFGSPALALDGDGNPIPVLDENGDPLFENGEPVYEYRSTAKDAPISASGYDGYAYGVIPLLEALGAQDVLTPEEYKTAVANDPDALMTSIIDPLLNVLDGVLADPLNELLQKLPNLLYFAHSGGLETSIDNILHAAYVLIDTVRPIYPLDLDLMAIIGDAIGMELDTSIVGLSNLLMTLLNDALGTSFALPKGSLEFLMTGTLTPFTSLNGEEAYRLQSSANNADFITALMRFAVEFLFYQDNRAAVVDLLGGLVNFDLTFLKQVDAIFESLRSLHLQLFGTDLVLKTLLNTFYTVGSFTGGKLNLLDHVNKDWVEILAALEGCDVDAVSSFGSLLKNFLDANFEDIIDSSGKMARGLIPFFSAVWSWIKRIWEWITWPFAQLIGLFN